jgi:hypothetical protein
VHPFGPPLYKLNGSSILNKSMGQSVVILGTYWGTWKTCMLGTSFGTCGVCWERHVGNTLGTWSEQQNPQKKRIYVICLMNGYNGI